MPLGFSTQRLTSDKQGQPFLSIDFLLPVTHNYSADYLLLIRTGGIWAGVGNQTLRQENYMLGKKKWRLTLSCINRRVKGQDFTSSLGSKSGWARGLLLQRSFCNGSHLPTSIATNQAANWSHSQNESLNLVLGDASFIPILHHGHVPYIAIGTRCRLLSTE